jgi:hypothetical protein
MTSFSKRLRSVIALAGLVAMFATAAPAVGSTKFFQSPNKNVGCAIVKTGGYKHSFSQARCDIKKHTWNAPPKPSSCHFDWGFGLEVGTSGKGKFVCASDSVIGQGQVLSQGDQVKFAGYSCSAQAHNSIRCHNTSTGHGFAISKTNKIRF